MSFGGGLFKAFFFCILGAFFGDSALTMASKHTAEALSSVPMR